MRLDGTDDPWRPWFSWYPVTIDVYSPSEIRDGQLRYRVWLRWIERRLRPDGPPPLDVPKMLYRLPQETKND